MCGPSRGMEAAKINPEWPWRVGLEISMFPSSGSKSPARPAKSFLPWGTKEPLTFHLPWTRLFICHQGQVGRASLEAVPLTSRSHAAKNRLWPLLYPEGQGGDALGDRKGDKSGISTVTSLRIWLSCFPPSAPTGLGEIYLPGCRARCRSSQLMNLEERHWLKPRVCLLKQRKDRKKSSELLQGSCFEWHRMEVLWDGWAGLFLDELDK